MYKNSLYLFMCFLINYLLEIPFDFKSKSFKEMSKGPLNIKRLIKEPFCENFIRLL